MQPIRRLVVGGLRGLSAEQTIDFAIPTGDPGSGLTVLVGSNNAGKSTFIEALRLLAQRRPSSFSDGRRNKAFGDRVDIRIEGQDGSHKGLRSIRQGGSETDWTDGSAQDIQLLVLPSRRAFNALFPDPGAPLPRHSYAGDYGVPALKSPTLDYFAGRLFKVNREPESRREFERLLKHIVDPVPDWTIDQNDSGAYFLRFRWKDSSAFSHAHSSDGIGEGLVSLLFIIDSLYDSTPGSMTVIDEPELSLHPQFQRRLRLLLSRLAADRQIVYATHSPYFVDWIDISKGAQISRIFKTADGTSVAQPSRSILERVYKLSQDRNNPHVLGLDASEVFFLEDRVILVEGQEDVIYLRMIMAELNLELPGSFFGWGVGGAGKMGAIAGLLHEMKYRSVLGILDNDKIAEKDRLNTEFPSYHFCCIEADDIRPKKARPPSVAKTGLVDDNDQVRPDYLEATRALLSEGVAYLRSSRDNGESIL